MQMHILEEPWSSWIESLLKISSCLAYIGGDSQYLISKSS
jgi:hypothetical protein